MGEESGPNTSTSDDMDPSTQQNSNTIRDASSIILGLAILWTVGMAIYQGIFISTFFKLILFVFVGSYVIQLVLQSRQAPWRTIGGQAVLLVYVWLYFSGAWRTWSVLAIDFFAFCCLLVFGVAIVELLGKKYILPDQPSALQKRRLAGASLIFGAFVGWCAVSGLTLWRSDALPKEPSRFAKITPDNSIVPEDVVDWRDKSVGIALSGGGYRAALFHAGVLNALETLGIRVQAVSSVSGGSIIGAYYALGGDPLRFKQAMLDHRFNLVREVMLFHHALRLPLPMRIPGTELELFPWFNHDRGNVQASMLRRLLGIEDDWQPSSDHRPELLIAATDLTYGMLVGFVHDGILIRSPEGETDVYRNTNVMYDRDFDLADLVAASGAFPVAFPAVALGVQATRIDTPGKGMRPLVLVDGGVGDNTGLKLLEAASANACKPEECAPDSEGRTIKFGPGWALDAMVVSDAGAIFGVDEESSGVNAALRAFDVAAASTSPTGEPTPLRISPSAFYLSRRTQFHNFDGQDHSADINKWQLCFQVANIPLSVLKALVDLLPADKLEPARAAYLKHSRGVETQSSEHENGECAQSSQAAGKLHDLIVDDIRSSLNEFRDTSTLEDQMGAERIERLFRLGQYLAYIKWPYRSGDVPN